MNTHRTETARFPRPPVIRTHSRHSHGLPSFAPIHVIPTASRHSRPFIVIPTASRHSHGLPSFPPLHRHSREGGNPEWFTSFPTSREHMRNTAGWGD